MISERLEKLFKNHPPKYKQFQEIIHSSDEAVLTINEIAQKDDIGYVMTAMQVLHNIGCLLYFPEVIPNKVFIKPALLLHLLYEKILSEQKLPKISKKELDDAVQNNSLGLTISEVEKLLLHFNLVFRVPAEKDNYYIPQYLPEAPAWLIFLNAINLARYISV